MKKSPLYAMALLVACFFAACGNKPSEVPQSAERLPDSLIKNVQTIPVKLEDENGIIKLNGKVQANEARQAKVFALVSGKVQSLKVELGDFVQKGQVLAVLNSIEAAGIANDLANAEANVTLAEKTLATTKSLYEGNLATEQDYLGAKVNYNKSLADLQKAKQVAAISGGNQSQYLIKAPISGYVIEKNITNNSAIRPDNNADLFVIADLSEVWIMANVYEADMNNVHLGDEVMVSTLANPEKSYRGKIDKVYNMLDASTRTMKVRISMKNANHEFKPEMFAKVKVDRKVTHKALVIPAQAMVMDNGKNYVVVKKNGKLAVQPVEVRSRFEEKAYITGLDVGDAVVCSAQLLLYQALTTN